MTTMEYENENGRYDDEPRYERDRSASPREDTRGERARSRSPNGRADDRAPPADTRKGAEEDDGAVNTGSNLFVTGIHPRLTEADVSRLFEKYGDVESCSIMVDPHTKESRGFGFVKMFTPEQADAAKEGLQGEVIEGRTLSIEKARRSRPRTPTPGKYFGPPKRDYRGPPRGRGDRYDDRRGYGYRRYDDSYRYNRYDSYSDRGRDYGGRDYGRRDYRDDYGYGGRGIDRYASRDDRYGRDDRREDRRDERRGYYDRDANPPSYDAAPPRDSRDAYAGRSYDAPRGEDRYASR
ncbi:hypothetical protein VTN00DRAFT_2086 [Thermoascus crustaceus]|uniref:uncharacterized protein n=1 Tax=Thermoascus crustaceus TaxID=5088 RepID=UPI0037426FCD